MSFSGAPAGPEKYQAKLNASSEQEVKVISVPAATVDWLSSMQAVVGLLHETNPRQRIDNVKNSFFTA